jgi:hypothetical protein
MAAMFVSGSGQNKHFYRGLSIDASYQVSVHLARNLVGSIYGRSSIKSAHFVPIH